MIDLLKVHSAQSAIEYHQEQVEEKRRQEIQIAGAKANIESYQLLQQQLAKQVEINQRLEHEFKMGAREAVITRKIAYWSLGVGIVGVVVALVSIFRSLF